MCNRRFLRRDEQGNLLLRPSPGSPPTKQEIDELARLMKAVARTSARKAKSAHFISSINEGQ